MRGLLCQVFELTLLVVDLHFEGIFTLFTDVSNKIDRLTDAENLLDQLLRHEARYHRASQRELVVPYALESHVSVGDDEELRVRIGDTSGGEPRVQHFEQRQARLQHHALHQRHNERIAVTKMRADDTREAGTFHAAHTLDENGEEGDGLECILNEDQQTLQRELSRVVCRWRVCL